MGGSVVVAESDAVALDVEEWPDRLEGVELVWHRLNRSHDLANFLRSRVGWAECDARFDPTGEVVTSHAPGMQGDRPLVDWLDEVASSGRSAKIDLKEAGHLLDCVLDLTRDVGIDDHHLWFNCAVETIGERGVDLIRRRYPGARNSLAIDTIAPWLLAASDAALDLLDRASGWGANRVSVSVQTPAFQQVIVVVRRRNWPVNVWDIRTTQHLSDAIAARPDSITADFGVLSLPLPR